MNNLKIDINSDLGEGTGNDASIMPHISSCNIACGGHAGDLESIITTVSLAVKHGVKIGGHPSFPDKKHFGRRIITMTANALEDSLLQQLSLLNGYLRQRGLAMHHVKAHGALYNQACQDAGLAQILTRVVKRHFPGCKIYAPFNSQMAIQAELAGIEVWHEAFADRRYAPGLALVPRSNTQAVIHKWDDVREQVLEMVEQNRVSVGHGNWEPIFADTICVHGDHYEAVQTAQNLHALFASKGYLT